MIALTGFISRQKRRRVCPRIARTGANEKAKAYLIDDYAEGKDTGIIDLVLVGNIDQYHLSDLSRKTEHYIQRKIRPLVLSREEFADFEPRMQKRPHFLVWEQKNA